MSGQLSVRQEACRNTLCLALHESIRDRDFQTIWYLLEIKRADPNYIIPKFGIAAIHRSICCGTEDFSFKVLSYCLLYGGNPNIQSSDGITPVHLAAVWNRLDLLRILVSHGGDPILTDCDGKNAFDYSKEHGNNNILKFLESFCSGSIPTSSLFPRLNYKSASTQTDVGLSKFNSYKSLNKPCVGESIVSSNSYVTCSGTSDSIGRSFFLSISNLCIDDISEKVSLSSSSLECHSVKLSYCKSSTPLINSNPSTSFLNQAFIRDDDIHMYSDFDSSSRLVEIYVDKSNATNNEEIFNMTLPSFTARIVHEELIIKSNFNNSNLSPGSNKKTNDSKILNIPITDRVEDKPCNSYTALVNDYSSFGITNNSYKGLEISQKQDFHAHLKEENNKFSPIKEYITDNEGFKLVERKYPPARSSCSENSYSEANYDTDTLKNKLKELRIFHGPITQTTKNVYCRQLKRVLKDGLCCQSKRYNFGSVISRTLTVNHQSLISEWSKLEVELAYDFSENGKHRKLPGGYEKCFFNYILIDPDISQNLPIRALKMDFIDVWSTFLISIFYVGKGKHSRPYAHFHEALKPQTKKVASDKVKKILSIWTKQKGVVCVQMFHNLISSEALTREAAMIDALRGGNLTNAKAGNYYGIAASWNAKQKIQLGAVLLSRALTIFLAEGERQISPLNL